MSPRTSLLCLLLLIAAASVSAQTQPARPTDALAGPLNLSQPAKATAEKAAATASAKLLLQSATPAERSDIGRKEEEESAQRMAYGAGFENRNKVWMAVDGVQVRLLAPKEPVRRTVSTPPVPA